MPLGPLLNQAPGHEDVCLTGVTAPSILNLGTTWNSVANFTPWLLCT